MYAEAIIQRRIEIAERELEFRIEAHSVAEVDDFNARLERKYEPAYAMARSEAQGAQDAANVFQSYLTRALCSPEAPALSAEEVRFIENERALVACNAAYFLTRHYFLKDRQNIIRHFAFQGAQRVLFDAIARIESMGRAIELIDPKARQLGVSTEVEGLILRMAAFTYGAHAVIASADQDKLNLMSQMMFLGYDRLSWWLRPMTSRRVQSARGMIVFGGMESSVSFQHGSQKNPIAMGSTPIAWHLSEVSSFINAYDLIEVGLFKAVHPSTRIFGVAESTAKGDEGWFYDTYWWSKAHWEEGNARLMALFLPFYLADDMYPNPMEQSSHPVPKGWRPEPETRQMIAESELYVQSIPVLSKVLGTNWRMPREKAHFWEWNFLEARSKGKEKMWFQEMPHCLTASSLVSTNRGIISIANAELAEFTESGRVAGWIPQGKAPTYCLTTGDGRQITGTSDHGVMTAGGWKNFVDLQPGEAITLCPPQFACNEHEVKWLWMASCDMTVRITLEIGRLLGYFMGDGSFHGGVLEVSVDERDEDVRDDVAYLLEYATGRKPTRKRQGRMWRVQASNQKWLEVLKALDCVQPAHHKNLKRSCGWKRKVHVPDCIFRSPKPVVKEFLSALFECDGHAYRDAARAILFSKYDGFLREVQLLLLGFGIRARFAKPEIRTRNGREYGGRQLVIPAAFANAFYDQIGFAGKRKQQSGKRRSEERTWGVDPADLIDTVKSVVATGIEEEVYDLSIDGSHRFSANGILVHNTDKACFQGSFDNVFGREVIARAYGERKTEYAVYGIVGQSIETRHEPEQEDVDYSVPRVPVAYKNFRGDTYRWEFVPLEWEEDWESLEVLRDYDRHMNKLFVWYPPERGYDYSIGVDTSNGISEDATCIAVCRRGRSPQEQDIQAAEFRSDQVSHVEAFAWVLAIAAYYGKYMDGSPTSVRYKEPYVAVEQVMAVGDTVQLQMANMGYSRFHRMTRYDSDPKHMRKADSRKRGWFTVGWSRPMLTDGFVTYVLNGWYVVHSPWTQYEMDHWEVHLTASGKEKFEHSSDSHDDGIFANAMAAFCPNDRKTQADRSQRQWRAIDGSPLIDVKKRDGVYFQV